jgi:hypothetical protein
VLVAVGEILMPKLQPYGPNPTPQQIQEAQLEASREWMGRGNTPFATYAGIVGGIAALSGLFLGARSLTRDEPKRGVALAACAVGAACFC